MPADEATQAIAAMRMKFEKRFEGPLEATSVVSMMGIMDQNLGSGGYVALEKVTGTLEGKKGSFCLQHSSTMRRGASSQNIVVIPDTGTEELKDLNGSMTIEIQKDGTHYYIFEYEFMG